MLRSIKTPFTILDLSGIFSELSTYSHAVNMFQMSK